MSLQAIIDSCDSIEIDRRRIIGVQSTRAEIYKTAETPTRNPWKFTVHHGGGLPYYKGRAIIEQLDYLDRRTSEVITFSNNSKLSWMFRYQGVMSEQQQNAITVQSFTGNQLVLTNLPTVDGTIITESSLMFGAGDIIQIGTYYSPFSVVSNVLRGSASTITLTTHRPNFLVGADNNTVNIGARCRWMMLCTNMPAYKIIPGATTYENGSLINNGIVEFTDSFKLVEYTDTSY
jgi:hypothetical protein